jgi:hypothetical protein
VSDPRFGGKTPLNGCSACRTDFASVAAFDKHRTGKHEYDFDFDHPDGRRCLAPDEMLAAGMELDPRGRWRLKLTDTERLRLSELTGSPQTDEEAA